MERLPRSSMPMWLAALAISAFLVAGCEEEKGTAESIGEKVDEMVEEAKDAVEDATEDATDQ